MGGVGAVMISMDWLCWQRWMSSVWRDDPFMAVLACNTSTTDSSVSQTSPNTDPDLTASCRYPI